MFKYIIEDVISTASFIYMDCHFVKVHKHLIMYCMVSFVCQRLSQSKVTRGRCFCKWSCVYHILEGGQVLKQKQILGREVS